MQTAFVTGSNRGLGLGLTRGLLADGWRVVATCRDPSAAAELNLLKGGSGGKLEIRPMSVTDWDGIEDLARALEGYSFDLLINNAGVRPMNAYRLGAIDPAAFLDSARVNALGALKVAEAFVEHLARAPSPLLVMMSSSLGSITRNTSGGDYGYRAGKAALNAVMRSLAADLRPRGVTVISLHPGWVRTDMGGEAAPLTVQESVRSMLQVLSGVGPEDSGKFLRFDGQEEPW